MTNTFLAWTALTSQSGVSLNIWDLVMQAGWVVKGVMLLLLVASVLSWAIIFWKWISLRAAAQENAKFSEAFWAAGSLDAATRAARSFSGAPLNRVFEAALQEFNLVSGLKLNREEKIELLETNVYRTLDKSSGVELEGMQRYLAFLASTSSTAPFIGLFGTVWGIMTSFINIGATGASNLAVVAPGIAEALIATAIGLFAAIPAALFYNLFVNRIKLLSSGMQNFGTDFLNTAKRSLQ